MIKLARKALFASKTLNSKTPMRKDILKIGLEGEDIDKAGGQDAAGGDW
jgi:hypothetical protein